ncbi:hypothetical protein CANCADRAFT_3959 [Tortispora caseinolytica NRRL Y-17796]|uniref:pyridoxal 5'-phosphate synthase n=1 Tax=Tortispora caseinolytica NRRL Y-17796 TaxID=767744 RepID=A0A1E4TC54_9ASCO|nr:hypothetical protein CANCADRAFT_3959 [Tortispora caseinolytica NRRL Y-17796]
MDTQIPEKLIYLNKPAEQYNDGELWESQVSDDPFVQFTKWFDAAKDAGLPQPEAMTFSTAELPSGKISSRVVLLKELDAKGFVLFSNWETSRKAADIRTNAHAALVFYWQDMHRQVRIEGITERITYEESQEYYSTRIRGSQIGAWASPQSKPIKDRKELENMVDEVSKKFEGQSKIPCPPHWGGLRIIPYAIEFWQGRPSRLHDRIIYRRDESCTSARWEMQRLAP